MSWVIPSGSASPPEWNVGGGSYTWPVPDLDLPPGSGFAFDLGERILASQASLVDAVDTKAAVVMGINGVLAGFLFRAPLQEAPAAVVLLASVGLLASLSTALMAFWIGRFAKAPEFNAMVERIQAPEAWLKWRFLPNLATAIAANERKLERKTAYLTASISGLLVLVVDVGGYLMYTLL